MWQYSRNLLLLAVAAIWPSCPHAAATWNTAAHVVHLDRGALVIDTTMRAESSSRRCFCPVPSERNLLGLRRDTPVSSGRLAAGMPAQEPTVLRVVAIRVEFPLESPDDPLTTGTGRFDRRDTIAYRDSNGHSFDSAPHTKRYFEAHLRALNAYWNTVSNDHLRLEWAVFPEDSDAAYQLPNPMSHYGRTRGDDSGVVWGLQQFVIDAAEAAAADPDLHFPDYDAVIIFHAGADRQTDIADDTPHDLFSAFLRLDKPYISRPPGGMAQPILLRAGADTLSEAIIMPETMIQDGRISVLNAVLAHEFGHQLGLVDLYNTYNGATCVGNFSLMDNNAADVGIEAEVDGRARIIFGALPVLPDPWSRAYLGFVDVATVTDSSNVPVWAAEDLEVVPSNRQVWRVPISQSEYYLLENRLYDLDGDEAAGLRLDSATNVVLGPADTALIPGVPPQLTREYDFLLPGNGLLIWHVDEGVAALDYVTADDAPDNFLANTLQWDDNRRFVRVIEADGLSQLGAPGIFRYYTGSAGDYYYRPHNMELSPTTIPPAKSYTGGYTGVRISNISVPGRTMLFHVTTAGTLPGFPIYVGNQSGDVGAPIITDIKRSVAGDWRTPGDGRPEVFLGYENYILAYAWDGASLAGIQVQDSTLGFDTTATLKSLRAVAVGNPDDGGWVSAPLIYNVPDQFSTLVAVSRAGRVYAWRMQDADGDSLFDTLFVRRAVGAPSGPPIIWDRPGSTSLKDLYLPINGAFYNLFHLDDGVREINVAPGVIRSTAGTGPQNAMMVFNLDGSWFVSRFDGEQRVAMGSDSLMTPALGDVDHDGRLDYAVVTAAGRLWVLDSTLNVASDFPVEMGFTPSSAPVLADVDRDGYLDIVVAGEGMLHAYARNGTPLSNFPITIGRSNEPDSLAPAAAIIDMGNTQSLALLTGGASRAIYGWDKQGERLAQMPRPVGSALTAPVAWALNSDEATAAIFARAADGYLYAFNLPVPATEAARAIWPMAGRDPRHTATVPTDELEPLVTPTQFFVSERAYVYPNPASDRAIVRYWLGDDATVSIRIYDLAGNLITEADGPGVGGVYNEWTWSCAQAASGVYFARLEVTRRAGGQTETAFCKLAVVQ
ncbi:MAG: T9SS type A sorting domain-containing protein [Candidatus Zixiibacteriota bacterium]